MKTLAPISAQTDTDPGLDWRTQAACKGQDTAAFFPAGWDHDGIDEAVAWCDRCPVRAKCLDAALAVEMPSTRHGIWGGLTPDERQRMRMSGVQLDNPECQVELTHNKKSGSGWEPEPNQHD